MLPGQTLKPEDIIRILVRRRWVILLPFALGLAMAPLLAKQVPQVYRSETLIMVIPQRVPDSYVKSTVTATVEDRLPTISDQILSRSRLERVINDFDLYAELRRKAPMEDVIRVMRADIGSPQIQPGAQSFRVSYVSENPQTAQKVTARLASLFIDENSRDRESLAESTNVFLESQLEDAKRRLLEHEQKLEVYRRLHAGELPSQLESNLQAMQAAQLQLQSISESANRARERRLLVERQIVDAETGPAVTPALPSQGGTADQVALTVAQQLEIAQRNLALLKLRNTPDHPDVRRTERTIANLKVKLAEEARQPTPPSEKLETPGEQAREKRIRDLKADLEVIDHQLAVSQSEEARLKALLGSYQLKIEAVPKRESELVELTRDYDILKKTYDSLLTKREDSKLAANLERRQIGEQFRILDPASLPVRAANQLKRLAISFGGSLVGLLLGLAVAAFLEYRDTSLKLEDDVLRVLTLPVLATVPVMASVREQQSIRRRQVAFDLVGGGVLLGSAAMVVLWGLSQR